MVGFNRFYFFLMCPRGLRIVFGFSPCFKETLIVLPMHKYTQPWLLAVEGGQSGRRLKNHYRDTHQIYLILLLVSKWALAKRGYSPWCLQSSSPVPSTKPVNEWHMISLLSPHLLSLPRLLRQPHSSCYVSSHSQVQLRTTHPWGWGRHTLGHSACFSFSRYYEQQLG